MQRRRQKKLESYEVCEEILFERIASTVPPTASKRLDWSSIAVPNIICSKQLVDYDRKWNSWAHYALEYPRFDEEHDMFLSSLQQGVPLQHIDTSWLAVYFSVLCVSPRAFHPGFSSKPSKLPSS